MSRRPIPFVSSLTVTLLAIACAMTPRALAAAADAPTVGDRGDPQRMTIEGARAFPVEQIREAIDGDVPAQVAAAPSAPLDAFLEVLAERVRAGYVSRGFPDARVTAQADEATDGVIVRVTEGPGYRTGGIAVDGAGPIPADEFVRRLTSVRDSLFFNTTFDPDQNMVSVGMAAPSDDDDDDDDDAPWGAGWRASFDAPWLHAMRKPVRRALAEMGFLWTRFDLRLDRVEPAGGADGANPDDGAVKLGEARLVVVILDPGARAVLGELKIEGLAKNTEAAVRELCGLVEGQSLDVTALQSIQQKLWDAARFKKHRLAVRPSLADPTKATLWIDLEELPNAPALGEPFSEMQQALLRFRDYLATMTQGPDDLVIEGRHPDQQFDMVMGFSRGLAMRFGDGHGGTAGDDEEAPDNGKGRAILPWIAARVEPGVATVFDPVAKSRLTIEAPGKVVVVKLSYTPVVDEAGKATWTVGFNTGLTDDDLEPGKAPVRVNLRLAPAAFVNNADDPDLGYVMRDGFVESTAANWHVRIDAATGRPLRFEATTDGLTMVARAEPGALRALADALTTGTTEAFDPDAPVGSIVRFGLGILSRRMGSDDDAADNDPDAAAGQLKFRRAAQALAKLLTPEVTEPLDRFGPGLRDALKGKSDRFSIPRTLGEGPGNIPGIVALFALPYANDLFPRGSWPWTVSRELLMVVAGRPSQSAGEVARVFGSPETGPLGYLVCAEALSRADAGSASLFAKRGLQRLSAEDFARDWRALIGGEKAVPQFLTRLVRRLGELAQDDVDALAAMLPADQAEALRHVANASRVAREAGDDDADDGTLTRAVWDGWLRILVQKRLKELSGGDAAKEPDPFVF